jgi:hypothetical protein
VGAGILDRIPLQFQVHVLAEVPAHAREAPVVVLGRRHDAERAAGFNPS